MVSKYFGGGEAAHRIGSLAGNRPLASFGSAAARAHNRLEYHIPQKFDQNRPGYILTTTTHATSIQNKLPRASDRPAVVCKVQELDDLVRDPARPASINDWLYTDSPQLRVHVNNFADATAITLNWPHTLADATGLATFMRAWSAIVSGQEDAVPALTPPGEDYLARLKASSPTEKWAHSHREISGPGFLYLGLRYALEKLRFPKEESRIVCVPHTFVKQLHTQAQKDLEASPDPHKPHFVSESDVLLAWWVRTVYTVLKPRPSQTIQLINLFDLRPILRDSYLPSTMSYFGNAFVPAHSFMTAHRLREEPLFHLAARIRETLIKERTKEQVEARATSGRLIDADSTLRLIGDGGMLLQICSNLGKTGLFDIDMAGAVKEPIMRSQDMSSKPSFFHCSHNVPGKSFRDYGLLLGKDGEGNWWLSWCLRAQLWPEIERLLKA
ncbi:hypothetical protein IFM61606_10477 [Aspergillus udagawae]|nr:hypothetical protein IFM61606_10477 [Aspergillus udagawae]